MALTPSTPELCRWGLTLLLPVFVAFLLPVTASSQPTRRWLTVVQAVGLALTLIGLLTSVVLFPLVLVVMVCAIFSALLQILGQFSSGFHCPDLPPIPPPDLLIQSGLALLVFATARRWRLAW